MVLCDEGQEDPFGLVHRAGPGSGQVGSAVSRKGSAWARPGAGSECTHSPGSLVLDARRESKCTHIMAEGRRREPPSRDGLSAPPFHHRPLGSPVSTTKGKPRQARREPKRDSATTTRCGAGGKRVSSRRFVCWKLGVPSASQRKSDLSLLLLRCPSSCVAQCAGWTEGKHGCQ